MKKLPPVYIQQIDPKINSKLSRHNQQNFKLLKQNSISAKHCLFRQNKHQQKPFRTLNHPYTTKIALIEKISEKQHHSKSQIIYNKELSNQIPVIIPNFRRKIARKNQTFHQEIKQQRSNKRRNKQSKPQKRASTTEKSLRDEKTRIKTKLTSQ